MNTELLIAFLREKGYKITPQRIAICEAVLSSKDHPSAEQVYTQISKKYPSISLTTIYHTLNLLKELNLVVELPFDSSTSRYDSNTSVHVNLICQKCNDIIDFESEGVKRNWSRIVSETGYEPIGQRLDIYIECDKCRK